MVNSSNTSPKRAFDSQPLSSGIVRSPPDAREVPFGSGHSIRWPRGDSLYKLKVENDRKHEFGREIVSDASPSETDFCWWDEKGIRQGGSEDTDRLKSSWASMRESCSHGGYDEASFWAREAWDRMASASECSDAVSTGLSGDLSGFTSGDADEGNMPLDSVASGRNFRENYDRLVVKSSFHLPLQPAVKLPAARAPASPGFAPRAHVPSASPGAKTAAEGPCSDGLERPGVESAPAALAAAATAAADGAQPTSSTAATTTTAAGTAAADGAQPLSSTAATTTTAAATAAADRAKPAPSTAAATTTAAATAAADGAQPTSSTAATTTTAAATAAADRAKPAPSTAAATTTAAATAAADGAQPTSSTAATTTTAAATAAADRAKPAPSTAAATTTAAATAAADGAKPTPATAAATATAAAAPRSDSALRGPARERTAPAPPAPGKPSGQPALVPAAAVSRTPGCGKTQPSPAKSSSESPKSPGACSAAAGAGGEFPKAGGAVKALSPGPAEPQDSAGKSRSPLKSPATSGRGGFARTDSANGRTRPADSRQPAPASAGSDSRQPNPARSPESPKGLDTRDTAAGAAGELPKAGAAIKALSPEPGERRDFFYSAGKSRSPVKFPASRRASGGGGFARTDSTEGRVRQTGAAACDANAGTDGKPAKPDYPAEIALAGTVIKSRQAKANAASAGSRELAKTHSPASFSATLVAELSKKGGTIKDRRQVSSAVSGGPSFKESKRQVASAPPLGKESETELLATTWGGHGGGSGGKHQKPARPAAPRAKRGSDSRAGAPPEGGTGHAAGLLARRSDYVIGGGSKAAGAKAKTGDGAAKPRARGACARSDCKKPVENTPCADGQLGTPPRKAKIPVHRVWLEGTARAVRVK
ncbi:hypothetical protein DIPPA_00952 [Diplonema papillatum]|nr:hypothetical protein DIPPA_00952 [Diplonema papillatum]